MTAADLPVCLECSAPATENAHLIPRVRGGMATVPLCGECHGRMHDVDRAQDIGTLTREGLEKARARGVRLGRPRLLDDATVARIVAAHAAGDSLSAIARDLNAEGVPTAQGGVKWYPATVRKVLGSQDAGKLAA